MEPSEKLLKGLKYIYIGNLIALVMAPISFVSIVKVGKVGALTLFLVGLYMAGQSISGCRRAFYVNIARLVVEIIGVFMPYFSYYEIFASEIVRLLAMYFVYSSLIHALREIRRIEMADEGRKAFIIYVIFSVIGAFAEMALLRMFLIPNKSGNEQVLTVFLIIAFLITALAQFVTAIRLVKFLKNTWKNFEMYKIQCQVN